MATRYVDNARLDHGAQFFTVRDEHFAAVVDSWQKSGAAGIWSTSFPGISDPESNGHPRYFGMTGMNAIPKFLAEGLPVRVGSKVVTVRKNDVCWEIFTEAGDIFRSHALIMTPPVPQTLALLNKGGNALPPDISEKLTAVEYDPCIAVLAVLNRPSSIPQPGGVKLDGDPIDWVADNKQKGISPEAHAITIHSSADFSRGHWDVDNKTISDFLISVLADKLNIADLAATVKTVQVHRWKYSQPTRLYPEPFAQIGDNLPLFLAGDAFHTPRIEGAWLSGLAAAMAVEKVLR
jgi:predicted NAD/FAD-dependent oxidoreductase